MPMPLKSENCGCGQLLKIHKVARQAMCLLPSFCCWRGTLELLEYRNIATFSSLIASEENPHLWPLKRNRTFGSREVAVPALEPPSFSSAQFHNASSVSWTFFLLCTEVLVALLSSPLHVSCSSLLLLFLLFFSTFPPSSVSSVFYILPPLSLFLLFSLHLYSCPLPSFFSLIFFFLLLISCNSPPVPSLPPLPSSPRRGSCSGREGECLRAICHFCGPGCCRYP